MNILISFLLMALCVVIHAFGVMVALRWLAQAKALPMPRFGGATLLLIQLSSWLIVLHLLEISVWAAFYVWQDLMPGWRAALYFSSVTYTTTGYGDLVLPEGWRLFGGIEALTGILMCGWSTGFFFAVVHHLLNARNTTTHDH